MKTLLTFFSLAALSVAFSPTAVAHCGSCGAHEHRAKASKEDSKPHHYRGDGPFYVILNDYERARHALLHDSLEGVPAAGEQIAQRAAELSDGFDAERAGVKAAHADLARKALPEIRDAARKLAAAGDIDAARAAFAELSRPLVRYREAVAGDRPAVVYCSMEQASWLQPEGEIGNPYGGQQMPRCGEFVSR
jgi:hypothetical protein